MIGGAIAELLPPEVSKPVPGPGDEVGDGIAGMGEGAGAETYRWLAWKLLLLLLLLLHRRRSLWLLVQTLASLAGVGLVWAAHTAVVVERMETASRGGSRALLFLHARADGRPRAL